MLEEDAAGEATELAELVITAVGILDVLITEATETDKLLGAAGELAAEEVTVEKLRIEELDAFGHESPALQPVRPAEDG
jgi:hypothetical protein